MYGKDQVRSTVMETSRFFQELLPQISGKENVEIVTSFPLYLRWLSFQSASRASL
jgi:hypothetical protein